MTVPACGSMTSDDDHRRRHAGVRPVAPVANAGTVSTGAIDDMAAVAEVYRDEDRG